MVSNAFHDSIEDRFLDVEARSGAAALAVIEEDRACGASNRRDEISVFEHDVRRFAAKFERHLLQVAGRGMHDKLPNFGRTGESYFVYVGMSGQGGPSSLAISRHNVHHAFGEAGFHHQFTET